MQDQWAGTAEFHRWCETLGHRDYVDASAVRTVLIGQGTPEAEAEALIMLDQGSEYADLVRFMALKLPINLECRKWSASRFDLDEVTRNAESSDDPADGIAWHALRRILEAGADPEDLALFAQFMVQQGGERIIASIDDGESLHGPSPSWVLMEAKDSELTGRQACGGERYPSLGANSGRPVRTTPNSK